MPELPEVQTIVNDLQIIIGDTITDFWSGFEKAIKSNDFAKKISGKKIKNIKRFGKNILIELSDNNFIIIHLKMTGKLLLVERETLDVKRKIRNQNLKAESQKLEAKPKHLHHIFYLKKNGALEFHDIRKFATLELVNYEKISEIAKSKGVDPLSKDFTLQKFRQILVIKKNNNIKSILMNQSLISGIGNIYASEIPYDAKINPLKLANKLSDTEIKKLYKSICKILLNAIKLRGTSFSDYRDASGKKGAFQNHLKVYGRAGKNCLKCDTMIEKNIVEQRSTFHCPTCQK